MTSGTDIQFADALDCLAERGEALREQHQFDWPRQIQETVLALRYRESHAATERPTFVAIVGGASSGKSTVFDNLLNGRRVSRVTARGHSTRGPILAVHDDYRDSVQSDLELGRLFPTFAHERTGLDDNVTGEPDTVHVVCHHVDALRGVALCDMPDLTSEPARREGDIALATLSWFDRLIVVVDHERWFDRQTIGRLRDESARFGQDRAVLFNRACSGRGAQNTLREADRSRLIRQAERLEASCHLVLEFRRGRGLCTFPPETRAPILEWTGAEQPRRRQRLVQVLGRAAADVLNRNAERAARLSGLHDALHAAAARGVPSRSACFAALMTPQERRHLDVLSRTLRITETREWLRQQSDRIRFALRRHVPILGPLLASEPLEQTAPSPDHQDRPSIGWDVFTARCERQWAALRVAAENSEFWEEVRRWKTIEPLGTALPEIEPQRSHVRTCVENIDESLKTWTEKVEDECRGVSPQLVGAVGGTTLAGAIVLVAVSGPVAVLTWPAIKVVLAGAFGTLATSAGAGALAGRPLNRFLNVVREKLLGSVEFEAVEAATDAFRDTIADFGRQAADRLYAQAGAFVLHQHDDLWQALTVLAETGDDI